MPRDLDLPPSNGHQASHLPPPPTKRAKISSENTENPSYLDTQPIDITETPAKPLTRKSYTVGWIAALPLEMAAARAMFDDVHDDCGRSHGDNNSYILGTIAGHHVALACLPAGVYGTTSATVVASGMRSTFPSIEFWLMVGIGGGVPSEKTDIRLGDVVIGTPGPGHPGVIQHDYGKTLADGKLVRTGVINKPPTVLLTAISKLQAEVKTQSPTSISKIVSTMLQMNPGMVDEYSGPAPEDDVLYESDYDHANPASSCRSCDKQRVIPRPLREPSGPIAYYGLIASGNQVIKDAHTRDKIADDLNILCFEMEAAGLADFPSLTIRGICDYADSHKNKQWQGYAAATAAAYAKELLSDISPTILGEQNEKTTSEKLKEKRRRYMDSLRFDQIQARESTIKSAHIKTCDWLLQHEKYNLWLDSSKLAEHHGFLWIKGKPGTGKSTLMKYALETVDQIQHKPDTVLLSFFFNARGDTLEKTTLGMYRSLLWQLFSAVPEAKRVLDPLMDRRNLNWSLTRLQDLFMSAVQSLGRQPVICFIDALDECHEEEVRDMVDFFVDLSDAAHTRSKSLHICFSSRHYPHITFDRGLELVLEGQEGHSQDLVFYLNAKLAGIGSQSIEEVKQEVLQKASGIFLWVVIVADILRREYDHGRMTALRRRLKDIPTRLSDLFKDILTRDQDNIQDLFTCLQWILFSKRLLTPIELYFAIYSRDQEDLQFVETPKNHKVVKRFILSSSKGLVEITKSSNHQTVQFIHESVRDFLLKDSGMDDLLAELQVGLMHTGHELLKRCCLNYLKEVFARQFSTIQEHDEKTLAWLQAAARLPLLDYATRFALSHAEDAGAQGKQQVAFVEDFPVEQWIYVDALIRDGGYHTNSSLMYIFADRNLPNLIRAGLRQGISINTLGEGVCSPIEHAFLRRNTMAAREMLILTDDYPRLEDDLKNLFCTGGYAVETGQSIISMLIAEGRAEDLKLLLDTHWIQPNTMIGNSQTILHEGICSNQKEIIQLLLDAGADVNSISVGEPPLCAAIMLGESDIVKLLLDSGANPNCTVVGGIYDGYSPLHIAILLERHIPRTLLLDMEAKLNRVDINHSFKGYTRLCRAIIQRKTALVKSLIGAGKDLNSAMVGGIFDRHPPLAIAIAQDEKDLVELLVKSGAQLNYNYPAWAKPLSYALQKDYMDLIKIVIANGANVNAPSDNNGNPPLALAISGKCNPAALRLLVASGAKIKLSAGTWVTFLSKFGSGGVDTALIELVLSKAVEEDKKDLPGAAILQWVVANKQIKHKLELVRILLSKGANPNTADELGNTALHLTSLAGDSPVAKVLLDHGAVVSRRDNFGNTALLRACSIVSPVSQDSDIEHANVIRLLLEHGADPWAKSSRGKSALDLVPREAKRCRALMLQATTVDLS